MKRRTILKALAGSAITSSLMGSSFSRRKARGASQKKLVVLFQRGGNDGLNTIVPVDSAEYARYSSLRPTIKIPTGNLLSVNTTSFFGLHPALAPLQSIINAGHCSLLHAVGYPNSDRSHFESQAYFETAIPGNSLTDGWLNRLLSETTGPGLIRGISIGSSIPQSVTGSIAVPVSTNFGLSSVRVDERLDNDDVLKDALSDKVRQLYAQSPTSANSSVYDTGTKVFQMIENFSDRNLEEYLPENGAAYPDSRLGDRVKHAAQMLKDDPRDLGVEVITIDQNGYDTHANQIPEGGVTNTSGQHYRLLNELASAMQAFYTDLGQTRMNDIMFLVVSEFGRRAYENDSMGTDHGTGSVAMVMGGGVNGSVINGDGNWPSLNNLYQDDDLHWVTDFRDIYWEILNRHMGLNTSTIDQIIPGHTYSPVGIIS